MLTQRTPRRRFWKLSGLIVCMALLIACGGAAAPAQPTATTTGPDPDETAVPTPDGKPTPTEPAGTASLEIGTASGAAEFKYDKDTLEAPAGSKIKLKFSNNTNPKDEVGHNWVLVKPGQEASVVANGKAAGDGKDWLDSDDPGIIAHTRLIEGGQSVTIRFDAPPPGTYTYLCTFPDHYAAGQKGTLIIK
ncbi:MAG: multicopper oxidase domain-containing protein [Chloroflexi bacterium]|nr:multicopper oxidase domain-containing protein [Chloroflexota bacterium]